MPALPTPRRLGPLGVSLCLHAAFLGAAGLWTVSAAGREDEPETFELTWRPRPAVPAGSSAERDEPGFELSGAEEVLVPEPLFADELVEPELLTVEARAETEPEPAADEITAESRTPTPLDAPRPLFTAGALAPSRGTGAARAGVGAGLAATRGGSPAGAAGAPGAVAARGEALHSAAMRASGPSQGAGSTRVQEPVALTAPAPTYPRLARRAGEEGSVLCRLELDAAGKVVAVEVVESSGFERLDRAAREALAGWSFSPRREDGRAVRASVLHRVTFRLSG